MDAIKTLVAKKYENLCGIMERKTVATEIIIYGTSGLMLLLAYAKRKHANVVRSFTKPTHIPQCLINERKMLTGLVKEVHQNDSGTLLLISRRPLLPFVISNTRLFPISLAGVKVNGNGVSWLQNCLVGREATFFPLTDRTSQYGVSQLCLLHPSKGKRLVDVSETLLKMRFACVKDPNESIKTKVKYYKHLANVETTTQTQAALLAKISEYPRIWKYLHDLKARLLPKEKLLPELLR